MQIRIFVPYVHCQPSGMLSALGERQARDLKHQLQSYTHTLVPTILTSTELMGSSLAAFFEENWKSPRSQSYTFLGPLPEGVSDEFLKLIDAIEENRYEGILIIIAHPIHFEEGGMVKKYCVGASGKSWLPDNQVEPGDAVYVDLDAKIAAHVGEVQLPKFNQP